MINILNKCPQELLTLPATELYTIFDKPTLIHLEGDHKEPLFISVLQHGNEYNGLLAIQAILLKYKDQPLPRSLSLFFSNIKAAKEGARRLENQLDFNRIWLPGHSPEHKMAHEILEEMKKRNVFLSIDIHDNTGKNPHYACITKMSYENINLAKIFSNLAIYLTKPVGTQTGAFSSICPSLTIECGLPGESFGIQKAYDFIENCLHLDKISTHYTIQNTLKIFHTIATLKIPTGVSLGIGNDDADIVFPDNLDRYNFQCIPAGAVFAQIKNGTHEQFIHAYDVTGREVSMNYFKQNNNQLFATKNLYPAMLTLDKEIIQKDCLGYLMVELEINDPITKE